MTGSETPGDNSMWLKRALEGLDHGQHRMVEAVVNRVYPSGHMSGEQRKERTREILETVANSTDPEVVYGIISSFSDEAALFEALQKSQKKNAE